MSIDPTNKNYSQLQSEAMRQLNTSKGGDEYLRKTDDKQIYVHNPKNKWFGGWGKFSAKRTAKRQAAATAIKESLNREFASLKSGDGQPLKMGDIVFRNLENPQKIGAKEFREINSEVAATLLSVSAAADGQYAAELELTAKMFASAGNRELPSHKLAGWRKMGHEHNMLMKAIADDIHRAAPQMPQSEVNSLAFTIAEEAKTAGANRDGQPVSPRLADPALGVNIHNLDALRATMANYGVRPVQVNEMRQEKQIEYKLNSVGGQLLQCSRQMMDNLEHVNQLEQQSGDVIISAKEKSQIQKFAQRGKQLTLELNEYLKSAPRSLQTRQALTARMARHVKVGKALSGRLNAAGGWSQTIGVQVKAQTLGMLDLCNATALEHNRLNLQLRPITTSSSQGNVATDLHSLQREDFEAINLPQVNHLYAGTKYRDANQLSTNISREQQRYNNTLQNVNQAFTEFQAEPNDDNLANLTDALDQANNASDHFQRALKYASRRLGSSYNQAKKFNPQQRLHNIGQIQETVRNQRGELLHLALLASQVNDQRSMIAQQINLPNASSPEQVFGRMRDPRTALNRRASQIAMQPVQAYDQQPPGQMQIGNEIPAAPNQPEEEPLVYQQAYADKLADALASTPGGQKDVYLFPPGFQKDLEAIKNMQAIQEGQLPPAIPNVAPIGNTAGMDNASIASDESSNPDGNITDGNITGGIQPKAQQNEPNIPEQAAMPVSPGEFDGVGPNETQPDAGEHYELEFGEIIVNGEDDDDASNVDNNEGKDGLHNVPFATPGNDEQNAVTPQYGNGPNAENDDYVGDNDVNDPNVIKTKKGPDDDIYAMPALETPEDPYNFNEQDYD